jgi:hypothetical protein
MFIVVGLVLGTAVGVFGTRLPRPAKIPFRWVGGVFGVLLVVDVCFAMLAPGGGDGSRGGGTIGTPQAAVSAPQVPIGGASGTAAPSSAPPSVAASSAAPPAGPAPVAVAPVPDPLYLAGLKALDDSGDSVLAGDASIRGEDYPHSVGLCADGLFGLDRCAGPGSDTWIEYAVEPGYGRVTASVGLSESSLGNCRLHAQVLVDNTEAWSQDVTFGDLAPVTVPASAGQRIRLQMHSLTGAGRCDLIYGDIALHRK